MFSPRLSRKYQAKLDGVPSCAKACCRCCCGHDLFLHVDECLLSCTAIKVGIILCGVVPFSGFFSTGLPHHHQMYIMICIQQHLHQLECCRSAAAAAVSVGRHWVSLHGRSSRNLVWQEHSGRDRHTHQLTVSHAALKPFLIANELSIRCSWLVSVDQHSSFLKFRKYPPTKEDGHRTALLEPAANPQAWYFAVWFSFGESQKQKLVIT